MAKNAEYKLAIRIAGKLDPSVASSAKKASSLLGSIVGGNLISSGIQAAGRAVANFVSDSVETYANFERSLANTAAIAQATSEEYKQLEAAARQAGKSTLYTASEAADALGYMALAGWDVNTSTASLTPVLKLAQATGEDLATTSNQVTGSMNALGLTTEELTDYLDVVIKTNNNAGTTASQLMDAYAAVGGTMRATGINYKDAAVALGILANAHITGSEAGRTFNSVLVRMATKDVALNAYKKIGVEVYDTAGNMRDLRDILLDTSNALEGFSQEEKNSYMAAMAGTNYYSEFELLLEGLKDTAGDGSAWDKLSEAVYNAGGALDTMNDKIMDTYSSKLAAMNSALDDLKIGFISAFGDDIQSAIVWLSDTVIPNVSAALEAAGGAIHNVVGLLTGAADVTEKWSAFLNRNKTALSIAAVAAGALAAALIAYNASAIAAAIASGAETVALGAMIAVETAATVATTVLGTAFAFLTSPITLVIAAIAAVIAIGIALYNHWDQIKAKIAELAAAFEERFPAAAAVFRAMGDTISNIANAIKNVFAGIVAFVRDVFSGDWSAAWEKVAGIFNKIWNGLGNLARAQINAIIALVNKLIGGINKMGVDVPDWVPGVGGKSFRPNIPTIPQLAEGGIATRPTVAQIAEAGEPEAVIPLSKLRAMLSGTSGATGGGAVTFAPTINISGNASADDVNSAVDEAFNRFKALMNEYERERRRRVFA